MENAFDYFLNNKTEMYKLIETRNENYSAWNFENLGNIRKQLINHIINQIIGSCQNKEVYILGHNNPDADSIISSYILNNIFKHMNISSHFCILNNNYDYTFHDKKLLDENFKYKPEVVEIKDKYFVLVDHNTLDGLQKEHVLGAFDHHIIKKEINNILEIEYASTSLLLYDLFKSEYKFSDEEKILIGLATLSDTEYLTSSRFTDLDKNIYEELDLRLDVKEYQLKYFVTTDFSLGININFELNKKEYIVNNEKIIRVQISSYNNDKLNEYIDKARELDYLMMWLNYEENSTTIYYKGGIIKLDYLLSSTYKVLELLGLCA